MPETKLRARPPRRQEAGTSKPSSSRPRKKVVKAVLLGLLAAVVLIPLALYLSMGAIARVNLRGFLEETFKAPVRLHSAKVRLTGQTTLRSLSLMNPPGYSEPEAFHVEDVRATTSLTALLKNPLVISELTLVQPEFTIEFGEKETNWSYLVRNAEKAIEGADLPLFIIRNIRLVKPMLRIAPMKLVPNGMLIRLNDVTLDYVGSTPDAPSPLSVAANAILQAVLTGDKTEPDQLPPPLRSRLGDEFREAGRAVKGAVAPGK